jgi:hypothetical protein
MKNGIRNIMKNFVTPLAGLPGHGLRPWLLTLFCTGLFCTLTGPSQSSSSGGTGSEIVGNAAYDSSAMKKCRVVAALPGAAFLPVVAGNVYCYQRSFVPDTAWSRSGTFPRVRTDSTGAFIITDAPPGEVVVEAADGMGNSLVKTITIDRDSTRYDIGVFAVKKTGAITIQAQTKLPGRVRFYVGVKGTRLVVRGSQTNIDVKLDNIPCGIPHTISIRVFEPIKFSLDIADISIAPSVTQALQAFQIK